MAGPRYPLQLTTFFDVCALVDCSMSEQRVKNDPTPLWHLRVNNGSQTTKVTIDEKYCHASANWIKQTQGTQA